MAVVLPPLVQRHSPNQSARLHGITPYLIVIHRPVGPYDASIAWLCNPQAQASAHIITNSSTEATQLVPWDQKAWACASFNSASYNLEIDDNAWDGTDPAAQATAARIAAFLCKKTGIPPVWSRDPTREPGVIRHYDLGTAGGGHKDPTTDPSVWRFFMGQVKREFGRGDFRPSYGVGNLARIDV